MIDLSWHGGSIFAFRGCADFPRPVYAKKSRFLRGEVLRQKRATGASRSGKAAGPDGVGTLIAVPFHSAGRISIHLPPAGSRANQWFPSSWAVGMLHFRPREVPIAIVHHLELATVDRNARIRKQTHLPAAFDKARTSGATFAAGISRWGASRRAQALADLRRLDGLAQLQPAA